MVRSFSFNGKAISLFLLYLYAALPVVSTYGQIVLYITIPGAALLSYLSSRDKSQSKYMKLLLLLFIWIVFTSFFSYNIDVSFVWLRRVLAVYLLCLAVHQIAKEDRYIPWVYLIWVIIYVTCLSYARDLITTDQIDYTTNRVSDVNLNANTLAYFTFFITVIFFIWGNYDNKIGKFCRLLFFLTIPLSFYVALVTASRQVLIIQVPLILFLLYIRYLKGNRGIKVVLFVTLFFIFFFLFKSYIIQIYESSFLFQRSQMEVNEDARAALIRDGIKTGLNNFFTGVGIGCFGYYNYGHDTFAHNTYVELFSTTGIVGFVIYVYMIISFIFIQFKRYLQYRKKDYLVFAVIGLMYSLDNMFYVFHTDPWLMAFFILLTCHAESIHRKELNITIT